MTSICRGFFRYDFADLPTPNGCEPTSIGSSLEANVLDWRSDWFHDVCIWRRNGDPRSDDPMDDDNSDFSDSLTLLFVFCLHTAEFYLPWCGR